MPAGTAHIPLGQVSLASISYTWTLRVRSAVDRPLTLSARFEGAAPPGATVVIRGATALLPRSSGTLFLLFGTPREVGPFTATLVVECAELPGWRRQFRVDGVMARLPHQGQVLHVNPVGVDLGVVGRGERRPFSVTLENAGSEAIKVREWNIKETDRVRLLNAVADEVIEPGATFELRGVCLAPQQVGRFETLIRLDTNIKLASRRDIAVTGVVETAYETIPDRLQLGHVHAPEAPPYLVRVRARSGADPFVLAEVLALAPYFDLATALGSEAATEHTVRLRLRPDAPHGALSGHRIRFRIGPIADEIDCPVDGVLIPSLICDPPRLDFGRIVPGAPGVREITIWHHANRTFRIKAVRARAHLFIVEVKEVQGMPPRLAVALPPRPAAGVLRDVIEVETDDPETPAIHIPVSAQVEP